MRLRVGRLGRWSRWVEEEEGVLMAAVSFVDTYLICEIFDL